MFCRSDDPCDIAIQVAPVARQDRIIKKFEDDGYEEGPGASGNVVLREGDVLQLGYRGNVKAEEEGTPDTMIYNSQLTTAIKTYVIEVDKFLQKSYNVYRGFVQVNKKIRVILPPKNNEEEDNENKDVFKYDIVCEHLISIPKVCY